MQFAPETLPLMGGSEQDFCTTLFTFADETAWSARLRARLSPLRMHDAYIGYTDDLRRMQEHERNLSNGLDHFKRAGHLAFWIRRFSPLIEVEDPTIGTDDEGAYPLSANQIKFRNLLLMFNNEYLAFDFGLQIVQYYEEARLNDRSPSPKRVLSSEYIETLCHFLKFKSASPHSLFLIYKSLYA